MKGITHLQKVLWEIYCEYTWIPNDEWYVLKPDRRYDWTTREYKYVGEKKVWYSRRSKEQWDFIRSKYYHLTNFEEYSGTLEEFISYLEPTAYNGRRILRSKPKPEKKYLKKYSKWRGYREERTKYQKKEHHKRKELSEHERVKREWRKKKKDPRDQHSWRYGSGKYKRYSCKQGHKAERRDIKMALKERDWTKPIKGIWYSDEEEKEWDFILPDNAWDDFIEKDRKNFIDPWDWY